MIGVAWVGGVGQVVAMDISHAVERLREGAWMQRLSQDERSRHFEAQERRGVLVIYECTADGKLTVWEPTQADILQGDWAEIDKRTGRFLAYVEEDDDARDAVRVEVDRGGTCNEFFVVSDEARGDGYVGSEAGCSLVEFEESDGPDQNG